MVTASSLKNRLLCRITEVCTIYMNLELIQLSKHFGDRLNCIINKANNYIHV